MSMILYRLLHNEEQAVEVVPSDGLPSQNLMSFHEIGLSVLWCLLCDVSIYFAINSYNRNAFIVHGILGGIITIVSFSMILPILLPYGMNIGYGLYGTLMSVHAWLGLAVVIMLTFHIIAGVYSRYKQQNDGYSSSILLSKNIHRFIGYTLLLFTKINIFIGWQNRTIFLMILFFEILFAMLLIHRKYYFPTMSQSINSVNTNERIDLYTDLKSIKFNYVIFADYIYNVDPLRTLHPAGYEVINAVVGRQVDRFIYGMYSPEILPSIPIHSHSYKCLELVGKPIGKLEVPPIYDGPIQETMNAAVRYRETISDRSQIYSVGLYLINKENKIHFKGYTDVRQLGQYYSLTISKGITRLYTSVHFIRNTNIQFMFKLRPQIQSIASIKRIAEMRKVMKIDDYQLKEVNGQYNVHENQLSIDELGSEYLPLIMKKYQKGQLTPIFLHNSYRGIVRISSPKGRGLQINNLLPGRIIIVAGGTGLFPFIDLIDLLFKASLIEQNHHLRQQIINQNPLLEEKPFKGFSFLLYGAFNQPQDIHPITLYQLSQLSKDKSKFSTILRIKNRQPQISRQYNNSIQFVNQRFDKLLIQQAKTNRFQKIWICGPPKLNTQTSLALLNNGFSKQDFHLI